jgi:hypothetical protein
MLRKSLGQFIRVATLLMMGLASSPALAQPNSAASAALAAGVTGRTAMSVTLAQDGTPTSDIRKGDGQQWIQTDLSGKVLFRFQEVKRDDTSIYLAERSRSATLQLDLRTGIATYKDRDTRRPELSEIRFASNVAAPLAQEPSPAPVRAAATAAFCWNDTVSRGAGTVPGRAADCPAGSTLDGATCKKAAEKNPAPTRAAECPAGYTNSGATCERAAVTKPNANVRLADCPEGFTNSGDACFRLSAATPLGMDVMACKAGETRVGGRCYKACETGFSATGASCTRPASTLGADKMTCKAGFHKNSESHRCVATCPAGFTNSGDACTRPGQTLGVESMTCKAGETRSGARCFSETTTCAQGEVQQGGQCFAACAPGFIGVGSACLAQPPKSWAQCGMGSAKDASACTALALDPITQVKQVAMSLTILAGAEPVTGGARNAQLATTQKKFKEMIAAYDRAKDTPQFKKARDEWVQANRNKEVQGSYVPYVPLESMPTATSEANMIRHATQMLAIVELSGAAVAPSTYPQCSTLFPSK